MSRSKSRRGGKQRQKRRREPASVSSGQHRTPRVDASPGPSPGPKPDGMSSKATDAAAGNPQADNFDPCSIAEERWVRLSEVAERLGCSERTVRNMRDRGDLRLRSLPGMSRLVGITESELVAFMRGGSQSG